MPVFCTRCGTSNEFGASFCESCGNTLRPTAIIATNTEAQLSPGITTAPSPIGPTSANQKKMMFAGAALMGVLMLGGGTMYFVLQPPAATASTLLAAAKAGYGKETIARLRNELCLANIDYSAKNFNASEYDTNTQSWMNALVSAGLYSPPVNVSSGGFFATNLLQYVATPELDKYREGSRLCLAKNVEIADVTDISKPSEEVLKYGDGAPKILTVKSKLVFRSIETVPWIAKPEVRDAVMPNVRGWEFKEKYFEKQVADTFGLRERKWTTGSAYKIELERQSRSTPRGNGPFVSNTVEGKSPKSGMFDGIAATLSNLLSMGGHPLIGIWQIDSRSMGNVLGMAIPSGVGQNGTITFTSNSIESGGQSVKAKFEHNGNRVTVLPEGEGSSMSFVMLDSDTATLDLGLINMRYKRIK